MKIENEDMKSETEGADVKMENAKPEGEKTTAAKSSKSRYIKPVLFIAALLFVGYFFTLFVLSPCHIRKSVSVYVYKDDTQAEVLEKVKKAGNMKSTKKLASILNTFDYKHHVREGRYVLKPGMSNFKIARILKSGLQTPIRVTFNNVRTIEDLSGRLSKQLMADSVSLLQCFQDTNWRNSMGFTLENYKCVFIPNTYNIYWNTPPQKVLDIFQKAYIKFWDKDKQDAAKKVGLTPAQICTLASIVEEETNKTDEMPKVAGLYLNRLRIGMPLQADPTIKYAVGDFTLKRILKEQVQKTASSPYNTYKHTGLPPGPIRLPSIKAVKSVLTPANHSYIYMCAKDDFSGYHAFATTLAEHNQNAARYHQALNDNGILQ
jgi:UPF0755 protein